MRLIFICLLLACDAEIKTVDVLESSIETFADSDGDGYLSDEDCDDNDGLVHPGAEEVCDAMDNNCDGQVDEGVNNLFYLDQDGDGFGISDDFIEACDAPENYVPNDNDCDDSNDAVYPSATEICDEIDNDCDTFIDEDLTGVWYADLDNDGFGDRNTIETTCIAPEDYIDNDLDCNDENAEINPNMEEVCDEIDNNCNDEIDEGVTSQFFVDADHDGFGDDSSIGNACELGEGLSLIGGDCDDIDPLIHPDAEEICDEIDNDCNGQTDENSASGIQTWYLDSDQDGYGEPNTSQVACDQPIGYTLTPDDCNDSESSIYPNAPELCDGIINDCNTSTLPTNEQDQDSDGVSECAGDCDDLEPNYQTPQDWYADTDLDGFGDANTTALSCLPQAGFVSDNTDCNDSEASIYPNAPELCDGIINDCNISILPSDEQDQDSDGVSECAGDCDDSNADYQVVQDWYHDLDQDGYGDTNASFSACVPPAGYILDDSDCDDSDSQYNIIRDWYFDQDADGFGDANIIFTSCGPPSAHVGDQTDCNDSDGTIYPNAPELCDALDNDCDGNIPTDEIDQDGDSYSACEGDCDESSTDIHPNAPEICNQIDDDCDGSFSGDEIDDDGDGYTECDGDCDDSDGYTHPYAGSQELNAFECMTDVDGDGFGTNTPSGLAVAGTDCADDNGALIPISGLCPMGESCYDILVGNPGITSDDYIIDPDGIGGLDPFEVYCDMTTDGGGWTEIGYVSDLQFARHFFSGDGWYWQPSDFVYELTDAQITAIQAVSLEGRQEYVGLCNHVIHYYYNAGGSYAYAFGFEFFDGTQIAGASATVNSSLVSVPQDGCAQNGGENASLSLATIFDFETPLVPIRNVRCRDCGDGSELFGSPLTNNPAWLR